MVEKKCRCGTFTKETNCSKELLCEVKCKNQKNCKKHSCSRKCCVDCLPCEKICVKLLKCGKHPCGLSCHAGNCYPCMKKNTVKCRCGATSISVNCGRKDRAPKCKELCKISSKCHHDPLPHKCHLGSCPSCVQKCSNILPCSHLCIAKCHDAQVKVIKKDKNFVPKVPGEYAEEKIEFQQIDCPPCKFLMKVVCQGGHEEIEIECDRMSLTTSLSCDRICNRKLKCGNLSHFLLHFLKILNNSLQVIINAS